MKRSAIRTTIMSVAVIGLTALSSPAFAEHPHVLQTPGTCVDKAGAGFGTGEGHTEPSFHSQVHTGKPGLFAFQRENNPVSVIGKTLC